MASLQVIHEYSLTCISYISLPFSVEGEDFAISSSLSPSFASGSTANGDTVCITVDIFQDDIYEEEQLFSVSITSVSPSSTAVVGAVSSVNKTIEDDSGGFYIPP